MVSQFQEKFLQRMTDMKGREFERMIPDIAKIGAMAKSDPIVAFRFVWNIIENLSYFLDTENRISINKKIIDDTPSYSSSEYHHKRMSELCDFKCSLDKHLHEFVDRRSDTYLEIIDKVESAIIREKDKAEELDDFNSETASKVSKSLLEIKTLQAANDVRARVNMALSPAGLKSVAEWRRLKRSITELQELHEEKGGTIGLHILKKLCAKVADRISR